MGRESFKSRPIVSHSVKTASRRVEVETGRHLKTLILAFPVPGPLSDGDEPISNPYRGNPIFAGQRFSYTVPWCLIVSHSVTFGLGGKLQVGQGGSGKTRFSAHFLLRYFGRDTRASVPTRTERHQPIDRYCKGSSESSTLNVRIHVRIWNYRRHGD